MRLLMQAVGAGACLSAVFPFVFCYIEIRHNVWWQHYADLHLGD